MLLHPSSLEISPCYVLVDIQWLALWVSGQRNPAEAVSLSFCRQVLTAYSHELTGTCTPVELR